LLFSIEDDNDVPANRHASATRQNRDTDYINQNESKQSIITVFI